MSFAERKPPRVSNGTTCSVAVLLEALDATESTALLSMLDPESGWTHEAIYQAILDEGHTVGRQTVGRHRGGKCRCAA